MLNFRKVLLAASVASLALVGSASAQVYTTTSVTPVGGPGYAFIEATTQLLPVINVAISVTAPAPTSGTFILNSNVAVTNGLATGSTSNLDVAVYTSTGPDCTSAQDAATSVILSAPTQITASFGTLSPALTRICVANLRVNASQIGASSVVTVTVAGVAGGNILPGATATTNSATVAYAQRSISSVSSQSEAATFSTTLSSYVDGPTGSTPLGSGVTIPTSTSICNVVPTSTSAAKLSGFAIDALSVTATPNALLTQGQLGGVAAPASATGTQNAPVAASQSTRLAITFNGLVAGVNYYYSITQPGTAVLVPYAAATGSTTVAATGGAATFPNDISAAFPITAASGSGTIYVGVFSNGTPLNPNTFVINLIANIPSNAAVQAFPTSQVTASVSLVGVATGYPQYSSTQTAYASTAASATGGLITSCSTTLLFPYVVNNSGFDTAMVITNASTGTGGTAGSGLCTVNFYGSGTSATTLPITYAPTTTLGAVTSTVTNNLSFTASGQAAGISGYAVATCNFVGAHGYAFLFSGAGTPAAYAADYLAVVLQSGSTTLVPTF